MSGQWKPGDLVMVTWPINSDGPFPAVRGRSRWYMLDDIRRPHDDDFLTDEFLDRRNATIRPLVVIDPEDREQVERLLASLQSMSFAVWACGAFTCMQAALREFATPTPLKPEEPTGLGAVVESTNGDLWVRVDASGVWACASDEDKIATYWPTISAVKVLSEGVTP